MPAKTTVTHMHFQARDIQGEKTVCLLLQHGVRMRYEWSLLDVWIRLRTVHNSKITMPCINAFVHLKPHGFMTGAC